MARLKYDNLYFFRYKNPATKVHVWDTAPLVIPLEIKQNSLLAINLHWIPKNERADFVEFIIKFFGSPKRMGRTRMKLRLFYGVLKSKAPKYLVAIRRYHISRITGLTEIPKEKWPSILNQRKYRERKQKRNSVINRAKRYFARR